MCLACGTYALMRREKERQMPDAPHAFVMPNAAVLDFVIFGVGGVQFGKVTFGICE